jgi:hypothetical protein
MVSVPLSPVPSATARLETGTGRELHCALAVAFPPSPSPCRCAPTRSAADSWNILPATGTRSAPPPRWCPPTTRRCSSPTPGWCPSSASSSARRIPAIPARHQPEVRARRRQAQRPGAGRLHGAAPHLLRDAGQLLVRRLLQARRDPLRLGAADRGAGVPAERLWITVHHSTTRRPGSGARSRASSPSASSGSATRTTSGRWPRPAPVGRARRSTFDLRAEGERGTELAVEDFEVKGEAGEFLEIWNLVFMQFDRRPTAS